MYVTVHWRFCFIFSFVAKKSNIQFMNWCKLFSGLHVRTKNNSWIGISFTEHSYFNFKAACNKVITWTLPLSWLDDCNYLWVTWIVCWVDLEELQCICAGPAEELCRACSGAVPAPPPPSVCIVPVWFFDSGSVTYNWSFYLFVCISWFRSVVCLALLAWVPYNWSF